MNKFEEFKSKMTDTQSELEVLNGIVKEVTELNRNSKKSRFNHASEQVWFAFNYLYSELSKARDKIATMYEDDETDSENYAYNKDGITVK